jgi:hypothetical protein
MKTKSILKLTAGLITGLITGMSQIHAATTNSVQNINFELTFFAQGPTNHPSTNVTIVTINKFRVTTRDIITALGQATSNNFSCRARLVSVHDATSTNSARVIEVRDGTNVVDVTSYFNITTAETNMLSVHSLVYNNISGNGLEKTEGIFHLTLSNTSNTNLVTSLDLSGFATTTTAVFKSGNLIVDEIDADVAGTGVGKNGVPAVVKGRIDIEGRVLRVE